MSSDPSFAIPARPERRYPRSGGVEYDGEVVFRVEPKGDGAGDPDADPAHGHGSDLESLVEAVLAEGPYRSGDFLELPMPLYLVRDDDTGDVFRVSVRDGAVRLHVLPETGSAGLRRFYDRLVARSDCEWRVDRHTDLE